MKLCSAIPRLFSKANFIMLRTLTQFCLLSSALRANAQTVTDSFSLLNKQRIATNKTGMTVLAGWGALNVVAGTSGYFAAKDKEWQSFHQMNALWGVVNMGIAGAGYFAAKKEATRTYTAGTSLARYESNKRLFLINAGLDAVYMGSGVYLLERGRQSTKHPARLRGYGKSILLQGAGLLAFDAIMYGCHQHSNKRWYRLLSGLQLSSNGVGMHYGF